jgi:hypothetical protein
MKSLLRHMSEHGFIQAIFDGKWTDVCNYMEFSMHHLAKNG